MCDDETCPEHSEKIPWIFTKCLCNPGYFDILNEFPMVCRECPVGYDAKEVTDAHATSAVKNSIEIYQNP